MDGTVPMELDATGAWRLTACEKERHRKLGLCDYCGEKGHSVTRCPVCPLPYPAISSTQATLIFRARGDGKRKHSGVTLGPSLGERAKSSPPTVILSSTLASPNPFVALHTDTQYSPLAYIDVDLKPVEGGEWMPARAMLDCGGQGSFINDKLSQDYRLPRESKQFPVSLVLGDGSSSQTEAITEYNPVLLRTTTNEEPFCLKVAPISYDLILGMPWLRLHNPAVRFALL